MLSTARKEQVELLGAMNRERFFQADHQVIFDVIAKLIMAGKAVDVECVPRFEMEVVAKRSGVTALAWAWQAPRRASIMEPVGAGVTMVRGARWYETPREGRGATAVEQSVEADNRAPARNRPLAA